MKTKLFTLCCTATALTSQAQAEAPQTKKSSDSPNIIWFLTEDLSPHFLALFNNGAGCETPNLSELASRGVIYPNAYSNAPVSSAARTTLITGCYAPSFEGGFHRRLEENPMPEGLRMFPTYMRQAGYYTINAKKQDYNVILDEEAWDNIEGKLDTWRTRPDKDVPFFMQRSVMTTHESRMHFSTHDFKTKKTRHNPDSVVLQPHLPDTDIMRYSYAWIYDRIEETDMELGALLKMLEEDGEADNTIIFFFGDNGGVLPGTKGYTDNIGVQVPLVVYVPEKWQSAVGIKAGEVRTDLVSFMDFAPTTLNIAGAEIPSRMDGVPFLGKDSQRGAQSVVCYGDRFDELYSFNRSIRRGDFRYERNYQPYQPQSLFSWYRFEQLAFQNWDELYRKGVLNAAQSKFFEPQGVEELYNLAEDPHELHNLAADPLYGEKLKELQSELNSYLLDKCDLSFFPENIIHEEAMANPDNFGKANRARIESLMQIADLQRESFKGAKKQLVASLKSTDDVEVWWALTACASFGTEAKSLKAAAKSLLTHKRHYVVSRAMLFLSMLGEEFSEESIKSLLDNVKESETLTILNDLTYMVESGNHPSFPISTSEVKGGYGVVWRVKYLQSLYDKVPMSELLYIEVTPKFED